MVKSYQWGGVGWVAHVIIETAPVPWFWGLGIWGLGDWGQGLSIFAQFF